MLVPTGEQLQKNARCHWLRQCESVANAGHIEPACRHSANIINRGRGPEIEGTRIMVYRIIDFEPNRR